MLSFLKVKMLLSCVCVCEGQIPEAGGTMYHSPPLGQSGGLCWDSLPPGKEGLDFRLGGSQAGI